MQNERSLDTTYIKPGGSWIHLNLGELWGHRDLLYFLTLRDIKIRYKQAVIGVAWAVLQPVVTVAIFTAIFSRFAQFDTGVVPYPLLALSGLVIWLFVHNAVSMASTSFILNPNLVTKIYFPRLLLPSAAAMAGILDLMITLVILAVFLAFYRIVPTSHIFAAPLFIGMSVVLAISFGALFSALNVRFRDIQFALPFFLQVWMIASPVFYPVSILPERYRLVFALNPLTGILDGFRSSLFGTAFDWPVVGISAASVVAIGLLSIFVFKWMEDDFADVV